MNGLPGDYTYITLVEAIHDLEVRNEQMREAMQTFVDRCEEGSIRSKKTYNQFKKLLTYIHKKPGRDLHKVEWLHLGRTPEYDGLKRDIAHVCHDVVAAACINELCINDIVVTFKAHGYVISPLMDRPENADLESQLPVPVKR